MQIESSQMKEIEKRILFFLILLLGVLALVNAFFGFSLPVFLATVMPSAILAFLYPRVALLACIVVTVLFERFFTLVPIIIGESVYKLYPLDVMLLAVLAATFFLVLKEKSFFRSWGLAGAFLLFFMALSTLVFLVGVVIPTDTALSTAFSTWKNYVFYGSLFYLTSFYFRTQEDIFFFAKTFFLSVMAALVFLLIGILRGEGLWTEFTPLSTAGFRLLAFPHAFYFSLATLALVIGYPWWKNTKWRGVLFLLTCLFIVGIASSLMRHLWLGLVLALSFLFLLIPRGEKKHLLSYFSYFFVIIFFFLGSAWFFSHLFPWNPATEKIGTLQGVVEERLLSFGSDTDESFIWRQAVWESALYRFQENPLFGVGFGVSVPVELGDYRQFVEIRNMHNSWLALLIQTGTFGLLLMLLFLGTIFLKLYRRKFETASLTGLRLVMLAVIFFQCLVFFSQPYLEANLLGIFFWISLGMAYSLSRIQEKRVI